MVGINMNGPARDRVMKLIEDKDKIESEIREHTAVLETNNVGMDDPLVDSEGFPRNDIDVYKVRHARHRIICLQNDHKSLMKLIEKGLAEVHKDLLGSNGEGRAVNGASSSNGHGNGTSSGDTAAAAAAAVEDDKVFAVVGFVHDGSPADIAGLQEHDEILQFGSVNHQNFQDMTQINNIVAHSVGQRVNIKVKRGNNVYNLTVLPRPWQQPGLLGCHIQRKS
ncbi:26S proteasome non-ATPase regulatory subunit 9 [Helicoverpa zea]|uniref:26S proteasome non-ATPase regulatory subunit 9 n=1 Tax=Helicoverpa zea TaxID=7113 RepID=UPI001F57006C|nr:26S proteasome non-ATPase regulatory subunit 9 [Helicoverpa zea]